MIAFINKRLELKIILVVTAVIACMIGVSGYVDVRNMREDTINTSMRTLGAFAAAIKGSVIASMKKGHHEDVRHVLEEVDTPYFINRVMMYDESGRPIDGIEKFQNTGGLDMSLPSGVVQSVLTGDRSDVIEQANGHFISYYSPIENRAECFRCHGTRTRLNGILRVDFSLHDLDDLILSRTRRVLLWSLSMIVLLTVLLGALLRTLVYRPVRELRDAMALTQEGRAPALAIAGDDELADLKKSFVSMLNRINSLHLTNLEKEKELAHSQEELRFRVELQSMFDAMPDGVLLIDRNMRIIQSNPRVHVLLPQLEPVGGVIKPDCLHKECCPFQGVEEVLKLRKPAASQCSIPFPNGELRHLHSICAPVAEEGEVRFVVQVIRDVTSRVRTERELEEKSAELRTANRLLSQLALTDSLTQVHNRRSFDELLAKEIKRFNRNKYAHLSLMMIDIDHFKQLNDRFGHLAGDLVLRKLAGMLRESVRETDTVARYGGEEFAIILPETHLDGAVYRAEALRSKIEGAALVGHETPITMTISIGVAVYASGTPDDLVKAADRALYEAKKAGRNRVMVGRVETGVKE